MQPHINKAWLSVIDSAQRAKERQETYLFERIPKLTTYKGFSQVTCPLAKRRTLIEPRDAAPAEIPDSEKQQTPITAYITVGNIHRVSSKERKKTARKKYKKSKLTYYGYSI